MPENEEKFQTDGAIRPAPRQWIRRGFEAMVPAGLAWVAIVALELESVIGTPGLKALPVVLLLGFGIGTLRFGRALHVVSASLLVAILLITWTPFFGRLARQYVRRDPPPAGPVDAIVVLSASVTADGDLSPHGADRLLAGLALYRQG